MKTRLSNRLKILIIILCSMLAVVLWENRKNLLPENVLGFIQDSVFRMGRGEGFPHEIIGSTVSKGNFKILNGDIAVVSDTSFFCLNSTAREVVNRQHRFSFPILKTCGNRALIYNLYGNGYQIESKSRTILNSNSDKNIISGAISEDGIYGLITESNGYFCEMTVFSETGKDKLYKYFFSEYYMVALDFDEKGKQIAAIGYTAESGVIKSVLYIFDYIHSEPKAKLEYSDTTLLDVAYLYNGNVVVVGDSLISVVDSKTFEKHDYSYNERNLTAFDINKQDGVIFSLSVLESGNNCEIIHVNQDGKVVAHAEHDEKINDISHRAGSVMVLSCSKILGFNSRLEKQCEKEVFNDAKKIEMNCQNNAYVLCTSEIRKVSF